MRKAMSSLAHSLGFEKLSEYERNYLHDANIHGTMFIGFITIALEIWMIVRQTYAKVIPKCLEGMDLSTAMLKYTSKFWLFLLVGLGVALFCVYHQRRKTRSRSKGWLRTLMVSGIACMLYTPVLALESFVQVSDSVTQVMADISNTLLVCIYILLFAIGLIITAYAFVEYRKEKQLIWLEHLLLTGFAAICLFFGVYVSYSDFWGEKEITCFLMMMIYVGYMLIYRPYITILVLSSGFLGFYRILLTYQNGLSFQPKEVTIGSVTHIITSGDTANYLTFLVSIITIFIAIYHVRLRESNESRKIYRLFGQTAEALATAIDAKDEYTHGHSTRVADYSVKIARAVGKGEEECQQIYYAALLHDVGKIGVPDYIINKDGKLTDEEFAQIKLHPVHGNKILSRISESPYLSIGAHYHHERYDGRGYPTGLKGEDIPEIARIIAVADAYDAMTSKRSYRDPLPQQKVREEMYKGIGTQFDPRFARQMIAFIDVDLAYTMKESDDQENQAITSRIICGELYGEFTEGLELNDRMIHLTFYSKPEEGYSEKESLPSLVIFDSLDSRIHLEEDRKKDLLYFEYARIRGDGEVFSGGTRRISKTRKNGSDITMDPDALTEEMGLRYDIKAVRRKDHVLVHIESMYQTLDIILALPDSTRYAYLAITGSHCIVTGIRMRQDKDPIPGGFIPRIAPEISYIEGAPVGDLKNLQIDGWRTDSSGGILLEGKTVLTFHSRSLPMARLVWHCPFILIFTSDNALVNGDHFREFGLIRLDGETWLSDVHAENIIEAEQTKDFKGWNDWKERHKEGVDITVTLVRNGNTITLDTENLGLSLHARTIIRDDVKDVYAAITGDECAVTDIHVTKSEWTAPAVPGEHAGGEETEGQKKTGRNSSGLRAVRGLLHREAEDPPEKGKQPPV